MEVKLEDAKINYIVSVPVSEMADFNDIVPGSKKVPCCECGVDVWLSPATQATFGFPPAVPVLCMECATKKMEIEAAIRKAGVQ